MARTLEETGDQALGEPPGQDARPCRRTARQGATDVPGRAVAATIPTDRVSADRRLARREAGMLPCGRAALGGGRGTGAGRRTNGVVRASEVRGASATEIGNGAAAVAAINVGATVLRAGSEAIPVGVTHAQATATRRRSRVRPGAAPGGTTVEVGPRRGAGVRGHPVARPTADLHPVGARIGRAGLSAGRREPADTAPSGGIVGPLRAATMTVGEGEPPRIAGASPRGRRIVAWGAELEMTGAIPPHAARIVRQASADRPPTLSNPMGSSGRTFARP